MRKDVSFKSVVKNFLTHDLQELLDTVEVEDWEQTFGQMQL